MYRYNDIDKRIVRARVEEFRDQVVAAARIGRRALHLVPCRLEIAVCDALNPLGDA